MEVVDNQKNFKKIMKTRNVAILLGLAAIGIGGVILYRRNLKKIEKIEETEKEELSALGVEPEKLEEDAVKISKSHPDYGDLKRFSDLPIPQQIVRLLNCSSNWSDEDLDWETAYSKKKGVTSWDSVHVVFKEKSDGDGYPNNRVGFFIEVPPLYNSEGHFCSFAYNNYTEYLSRLSQGFWATHKIECARPASPEVIGLYSRSVEVENSRGEKFNLLQYERIPTKLLLGYSKYDGDVKDGLYRYFSSVHREWNNEGVDILPDGIESAHLFMGVWFKLECEDTDTYGMSIKQILMFLEEMVLKDNYTLMNSGHTIRRVLKPVIIHPGSEFELILNHDLKVLPIEF